MSFRTRLFLALVLAVLVPLGALAYGVRREMERRLTAEYEGRVGSMASIVESDLERESRALAARLAALASDLAGSDRFRLAALAGRAHLPALPARLCRRRDAALRPRPASDAGQRRPDSQLRPLPERVRPAAARASPAAGERRQHGAGPDPNPGSAAAGPGAGGLVPGGRQALQRGGWNRGRGAGCSTGSPGMPSCR